MVEYSANYPIYGSIHIISPRLFGASPSKRFLTLPVILQFIHSHNSKLFIAVLNESIELGRTSKSDIAIFLSRARKKWKWQATMDIIRDVPLCFDVLNIHEAREEITSFFGKWRNKVAISFSSSESRSRIRPLSLEITKENFREVAKWPRTKQETKSSNYFW